MSQGRWRSDSAVDYSYQWRRCLTDGTGCIDIPKATDRVYAVRSGDIGHTLLVVVTAANKDGASSATSTATAAVTALPAEAPHNTVLPAISGSAKPGQVLTAAPGTWTGAAPIRFSYRWRLCDPAGGDCEHTGVQTQTYKLSPGDAEHALRVLVTATNAAGASAALSDPSPTVASPSRPSPARPQATSSPRISGMSQQGQTLTGDRGQWSGNPSDFDYSWLRCDTDGDGCAGIRGAHATTYTLRSADVGHTIRFRVRARNRAGRATVFSAPTAVVAAASRPSPARPQATSSPRISGTPQQGQTLKGDRGSWSDNPTDFDYSWLRCDRNGNDCDQIGGAHATTYTLTSADVGHAIRFKVEAKNAGGSATGFSAPSAVVGAPSKPAPARPQNTSSPRISGTPQQGQTLKGDRGSWSNNPSDYDHSWLRCDKNGDGCGEIGGAHATTYTLTSADVGHTLRFRVEAKNAGGSATGFSAPTAVVAASKPSPPANTSRPTISGTAQEGKTLTGNRGTWSGNPTDYDFSWRRCNRSGDGCDGIGGAHGTTYTPTAADVGRTLRFRVEAKNAGGSTSVSSAPTAAVRAAAKPENTSPPTTSGTPQEGKTLTGTRGTWTHNPTDYDHSWLRCDRNGGSCAAIGGAHATTYALSSADAGNTVRFRVTAKNSEGSTTATSVPTAVIQKAAPAVPAKPGNSSAPTISGTPQEGTTLSANRGTWTNNPTAYDFSWLRCDRNGGSCAAIGGARGSTYAVTSADVGNTLRLQVTATNAGGSTTVTSVPTAVIQGAPLTPPRPRPNGCPARGNPDRVAAIRPPARLLVDAHRSIPHVVTRRINTLIVRFHVTSTCGGPVQGALVYATATPFNQFAIPAEQPTGVNGWATLVFRRLRGFPVSPRQQLIAMFVRARKPGENLLGGISTRRLVSVPVSLR